MKIGVPSEQFPGEHRVALVPASIAPLKKAGLDVIVERGAGERAGFPDAAYLDKGAQIAASRARCVRRRCRAAGARGRSSPLDAPGPGRHRHGRSARLARDGARHRVARRHRVRARADSAHHARAEHGRAVVDGDDRRIQGGAAGGRDAAAHVPAADDRRRHRSRPRTSSSSASASQVCRRSPPPASSARSSRPTTCVRP